MVKNKKQTKKESPKKEEVLIEEIPAVEEPKEEAPKEEAPKEEAPKEEAPKEEAPEKTKTLYSIVGMHVTVENQYSQLVYLEVINEKGKSSDIVLPSGTRGVPTNPRKLIGRGVWTKKGAIVGFEPYRAIGGAVVTGKSYFDESAK